MPPEVSKTIVCTKYSTWRGYGHQVCVGRQTLCYFFYKCSRYWRVCLHISRLIKCHSSTITLIGEKGKSKGCIACMGQKQHLVFWSCLIIGNVNFSIFKCRQDTIYYLRGAENISITTTDVVNISLSALLLQGIAGIYWKPFKIINKTTVTFIFKHSTINSIRRGTTCFARLPNNAGCWNWRCF